MMMTRLSKSKKDDGDVSDDSVMNSQDDDSMMLFCP
jgi:hypothetical protein